MMPAPHNKHMLRAGTHKVLGRGRFIAAPVQVLLARVLTARRAGADVGRWASLQAYSQSGHR
jgi:hypothetical protein